MLTYILCIEPEHYFFNSVDFDFHSKIVSYSHRKFATYFLRRTFSRYVDVVFPNTLQWLHPNVEISCKTLTFSQRTTKQDLRVEESNILASSDDRWWQRGSIFRDPGRFPFLPMQWSPKQKPRVITHWIITRTFWYIFLYFWVLEKGSVELKVLVMEI